MTETFEVGQTVKHQAYGDVEVSYGPFRGRFTPVAYLVRHEDGRETVASEGAMEAIPAPPKFAVGDKVTHETSGTGKIVFGPFAVSYDPESYLVHFADGHHWIMQPDSLTKAVEPGPIKVGDRVRVVRAYWGENCHGKTGTVVGTDARWTGESDADIHQYRVEMDDSTLNGGPLYAAEVERVEDESVYQYDGVTYDLTAQYRDQDGDKWKLRRDPDNPGKVQAQMTPVLSGEWSHYTLETLVTRYGPLIRV